MAMSLLNRFISSTFRVKAPEFALTTRLTISSLAEKYVAHFLNHSQNPEKSLFGVRDKLGAPCVTEVLNRFSTNKPILGLRFFIWAGVQSNYRHTQYMYSLACNVLEIRQNPGRIREILEVYRVEGCVTNVKMVKVVLNLCKEARIAEEALWVLRRMEVFKCRPDSTMYNVVIGLFCEKGNLDVAVGLMREMQGRSLCPDMITYMAMLKGFCSAGRLVDGCMLFKTMKSNGCVANLVAYSTLLDGLCKFGHFERALELLGEMENEGGECAPSVISYTAVIQNMCENGKSIDSLSVLSRMEHAKCGPNRVTISVLIKGLCEEGFTDEAYKLVGRMVAGGQVSSDDCYSALVMALLRIKRPEEAEKLFRWMLDSGVRPDGLACSILMKDMCLKGRFVDAYNLFEDVEKKGFVLTIDSEIYSILLRGLSPQMHVVEMAKLARLMVEKQIQIDASDIEIKKPPKGTKERKQLAR